MMSEREFKSKAAEISRLLASFGERPGEDPVERARAFMRAAETLPLKQLQEAVGRFCEGLVEGHSPRFCPNTAELCVEVRRLVALERYEAHKLAADKLPKPKPEPVISEEQRAATIARLRAKFPSMFRPADG